MPVHWQFPDPTHRGVVLLVKVYNLRRELVRSMLVFPPSVSFTLEPAAEEFITQCHVERSEAFASSIGEVGS